MVGQPKEEKKEQEVEDLGVQKPKQDKMAMFLAMYQKPSVQEEKPTVKDNEAKQAQEYNDGGKPRESIVSISDI